MFGPTVGDRLRLADTALVVKVEKDHTVWRRVKFGGGRVIRDGMGQGPARFVGDGGWSLQCPDRRCRHAAS